MTVTGTVTGEVTDPSGAPVSEANITLVSNGTRESRTAVTGSDGSFRFLAVPPEAYTLRVAHTGFKTYERTQVTLTANERLDLGQIQVQLGAVTETISVQAQGAAVQTDSSENSAVLTNNQISNLTARGRDVVSLLRTIPGVGYQADQDSVGGSYGTTTPSIAGTSSNANTLAVDGVVSNDVGTPGVFSSVTTLTLSVK
jgi:hypothetical protein